MAERTMIATLSVCAGGTRQAVGGFARIFAKKGIGYANNCVAMRTHFSRSYLLMTPDHVVQFTSESLG